MWFSVCAFLGVALAESALDRAFADRDTAPFAGLSYPLEATRLLPQMDDGRLVLTWTDAGEWSLVGGISKSVAPGDSRFTDFRPPVDSRYLRDGAQLSPAENAQVVVESPLAGLTREADEELGGPVPWFDAAVVDGRWIAVDVTHSGFFRTYVCLCRVSLDEAQLALLNATIAGWPHREHRYFAAFPWSVGPGGRIVVAHGPGRMRRYDETVVFGAFAKYVLRIVDPARGQGIPARPGF
jgi:hypothetical protein